MKQYTVAVAGSEQGRGLDLDGQSQYSVAGTGSGQGQELIGELIL